MFRAGCLLLSISLFLSGCTTLQRLAHGFSDRAPQPLSFQFEDGVSSTYYEFSIGASAQPDTVLFFYGGSGCPSWKYVMPDYVRGLPVDARVFVLNKRFVADRSTGLFGCGREFHLANHPAQWAGDYARFIDARLRALPWQPCRVVLLGMGEADRSVPVASARALVAEFQAAGKPNLRLEVYPGADHRLSAPGVEYRDAFFRTLGELLREPADAGASAGKRPSSRGGS